MLNRATYILLLIGLLQACNSKDSPIEAKASPVDVVVTTMSLPSDQQIEIDINGQSLEITGQEQVILQNTFYEGERLWPQLISQPQDRSCVIEHPSYNLQRDDPESINIDCSVVVNKSIDALTNLTFLETDNYVLGIRNDSVAILDLKGNLPVLSNNGQKFDCNGFGNSFRVKHLKDDQIVVYCSGKGFAVSDVSTWADKRLLNFKYQLPEISALNGMLIFDNSIIAVANGKYPNARYSKITLSNNIFTIDYSNNVVGNIHSLQKLSDIEFAYLISEGNKRFIKLAEISKGINSSDEVLFESDEQLSLINAADGKIIFYHDHSVKILSLSTDEIEIITSHERLPNNIYTVGDVLYISYDTAMDFNSYVGTEYHQHDSSRIFYTLPAYNYQNMLYRYQFNSGKNKYERTGVTSSITKISDIQALGDKLLISSEMESTLIDSTLDQYHEDLVNFDPIRTALKFTKKDNLLAVAEQELGIYFYLDEKSGYSYLTKIDGIGTVFDVQIDDNKLYAALGDDGVKIFDISDLSNIRELGNFNSADSEYPQIRSLAVVKGYVAYRGIKENHIGSITTNMRVFLVDTTNPSNPKDIRSFDLGTSNVDVYNAAEYRIYANSRAFYFFQPAGDYATATVEVTIPDIADQPLNWTRNIIDTNYFSIEISPPLAVDVDDSRMVVSFMSRYIILEDVGTPSIKLLEFNEDVQQWIAKPRINLDSPAIRVSLGASGFTIVDFREAKEFDYLNMDNPVSLFLVPAFVSDMLIENDGLLMATDFWGISKASTSQKKATKKKASGLGAHHELHISNNQAFTGFDHLRPYNNIRKLAQVSMDTTESEEIASIVQFSSVGTDTQFITSDNKIAYVDRLFGYSYMADFSQAEATMIQLVNQKKISATSPIAQKSIKIDSNHIYAVVDEQLYGYSFDGNTIEVHELGEIKLNSYLFYVNPYILYCNVFFTCERFMVGEEIPSVLPKPDTVTFSGHPIEIASDNEYLYSLESETINNETQLSLNIFRQNDDGIVKIHTEVLMPKDISYEIESKFRLQNLNGIPVLIVNGEVRRFKYENGRIKFTSSVHLLEEGSFPEMVGDEMYFSKNGNGLVSVTGF
ncbi:hypothetical protein [Gynuella sp.]|uniref:hypothetical protein n=1 Tax=Gynuella sp. TaxID=2969146 RepID=UPI003D0E053B